MIHQGSCHCGKISFEVDADINKVIECNCSHCTRKGFVLSFHPRDTVRITAPEDALATYTFNKHVIKHHFCKVCGCAPFGFGTDPSGNLATAINVRCIPALDMGTLTITKVDGKKF